MSTKFIENCLDLPNVKVNSYSIVENEIHIYIETLDGKVICRTCGKEAKSKGRAEEIKLQHLRLMGKKTYLFLKPKRGICTNCKERPTTNQRVSWYQYKSRYTKAYEDYILLSLINSTVVDVSVKHDIGESAVLGIMQRNVKDKFDCQNLKKIGLLGLDEISKKKGYKDFLTLVTSHYKGKTTILAVLSGRDSKEVEKFLKSIPKKLVKTIAGACVDLNDDYIKAAKAAFNNQVPVVADRFHVAKLYRKSLVKIRQKELERLRKILTEDEYKKLKSAILIMRTKGEVYDKKDRKKLEPLFKLSPLLKAAHKYSCQLTGIYNSKINKAKASEKITQWIEKVESSEVKGFKHFIATLQKYKAHIIEYFKGRKTSGFVEGFNNKAKVLKRRCYGFDNVNNIFRRLWLDCCGYAVFESGTGFAAS